MSREPSSECNDNNKRRRFPSEDAVGEDALRYEAEMHQKLLREQVERDRAARDCERWGSPPAWFKEEDRRKEDERRKAVAASSSQIRPPPGGSEAWASSAWEGVCSPGPFAVDPFKACASSNPSYDDRPLGIPNKYNT